mmetsp:Transcript_20251/g.54067  ORF Transcript_20251/g.54067 Transcript_20251/m.54067 type:complete len:303 (-) Transcript_20251:1237-2145(-)
MVRHFSALPDRIIRRPVHETEHHHAEREDIKRKIRVAPLHLSLHGHHLGRREVGRASDRCWLVHVGHHLRESEVTKLHVRCVAFVDDNEHVVQLEVSVDNAFVVVQEIQRNKKLRRKSAYHVQVLRARFHILVLFVVASKMLWHVLLQRTKFTIFHDQSGVKLAHHSQFATAHALEHHRLACVFVEEFLLPRPVAVAKQADDERVAKPARGCVHLLPDPPVDVSLSHRHGEGRSHGILRFVHSCAFTSGLELQGELLRLRAADILPHAHDHAVASLPQLLLDTENIRVDGTHGHKVRKNTTP